ncbi:lipid-A-disaccharide synthase [Hyphobacterium sp.]|uniref:lipid-A-disaccharide synthase n=1 Tax=Hyphobacterium sp. TaxID=2004662 RepID=UPI003BAD5B15
MSEPLRIFIVAVEPSGDALGADLIASLRALPAYTVEIAGVGGERMAALGVQSAIDISDLAILGLLDGLKSYGTILKRVNETVDAALEFGADSVVLIDSWGFMIRVAQRLQKRANPPVLIKYVGPQIWAARPRRAEVLAHSVDHLLTIHAFDQPMFEAAGLPTTFVGNPALERPVTGDGKAFRARHGISDEARVIGVLFGSRPSELRRMGPDLRAAIRRLNQQMPEAVFVSPMAPVIAKEVRHQIEIEEGLPPVILIEEAEKRDANSAMDAALAVSGTATTELALAGIPTVACYRLGALSYWIYRHFLFKADHISLVNIAANARLIPEFVQTEATAENLASAVMELLEEVNSGNSRGPRLREAALSMKGEGRASDRAAHAVAGLTAAR